MSLPIVFVSYSHEPAGNAARVAALVQRLRDDGLTVRFDQDHRDDPDEQWPRWILDRLDEAAVVLCVSNESYHRRARGHETPGKGRGVRFEGAVILNLIYEGRTPATKYLPVLFSREDERFILELDERSFGKEHPKVARDLNNLAQLLQATNRLTEAEPLMRQCWAISCRFREATGYEHPKAVSWQGNYRGLLSAVGLSESEIAARMAGVTGSEVQT